MMGVMADMGIIGGSTFILFEFESVGVRPLLKRKNFSARISLINPHNSIKSRQNFLLFLPSCMKTAIPKRILPEQKAMLLQFDSDRRFGPVTGLTRRARWERAAALNLAPPPEVIQLLEEFPSENTKGVLYGSAK